jgi:hypothetical protein
MKYSRLTFAFVLGLLVTPHRCFASLSSANNVNIIVGTTTMASPTSGIIWLEVPGVTLHENCKNSGTKGYLYIEANEKEMFAVALSAQLNGLPAYIFYENDGPARTLTSTVSKCKVLNIRIE